MTALDRYAKLEAIGRYLDGRSPAAREVVLSFGERSLIIMGMDDRPIAHWPLASLRALRDPAERPLELVPDPTSDERLLLDDREMSEAIAAVCPDLHRRAAPARRRLGLPLRLAAGAAVVLAAVAAAVVLVPELPDRLTGFVPPEREEALGEMLAGRLPARVAGASGLCTAEEGTAALRGLTARLVGDAALPWPLRVTVVDAPGADALALPGGRILVFRGLIEAGRSPEEVAGVLAHAIGHARRRDPLRAVMRGAGMTGMASILVGDITGAAILSAASAALLDTSYPPGAEAAADAAAFETLAAAGLPSRPYAAIASRLAAAEAGYADRHPWAAGRAAAAGAADTVGDAPFRPALRDRDWIALGNVCDRTAPLPSRY